MTNYYIADLHFGHENALAYDNRPFVTAEENDSVIMDRWNDTVNVDDDVYLLGDVSHHNVTKTTEIIKQLNGNIHMLLGNHDNRFMKNKYFRDCFVEIERYKKLDLDNGKHLILSHYPMICFDGQFRHDIHLYAHVHNSAQWNVIEHTKMLMEKDRGEGTCRMFNVGCMLNYMNYTPRTLEEILNACEGKTAEDILDGNERA